MTPYGFDLLLEHWALIAAVGVAGFLIGFALACWIVNRTIRGMFGGT